MRLWHSWLLEVFHDEDVTASPCNFEHFQQYTINFSGSGFGTVDRGRQFESCHMQLYLLLGLNYEE